MVSNFFLTFNVNQSGLVYICSHLEKHNVTPTPLIFLYDRFISLCVYLPNEPNQLLKIMGNLKFTQITLVECQPQSVLKKREIIKEGKVEIVPAGFCFPARLQIFKFSYLPDQQFTLLTCPLEKEGILVKPIFSHFHYALAGYCLALPK